MNGPARFVTYAAVLAGLVLSLSGCRQLEARNQLNKGVDAYKSAHYEQAIGHFQRATELDPRLAMAKTYLATALAQNVVPGETTPDNLQTANRAIAIFKQVLAKDPSDVNSVKQIAGIYFSINDFELAKTWQRKALAMDPSDPVAAYTIGAIDWREAHEALLKVLQPAGINDDGKGNVKAPKKLMLQVSKETAPLVTEGLKYLHQAVQEKPDYADAMAYLNLMYRSKADVDYGDAAKVKEDLAQAEFWTKKAMATRRLNEEKKRGPGGVTMSSKG
jgi:tetratricopeptide (TPR) repeat protein